MSIDPSPPVRLLPTVSIVEETMRQARRAVAFALLGAALLAALLLGQHQWSSVALQQAADRHAMAHKLVGEVRVADQQLALAAQMAAITGESHWIDRFDKLVPELALAIEHASLLAPQAVAASYRERTAEAARLQARMNASAAEALKSGAFESARALFDSERYVAQSRLLRAATEELTQASLTATEQEVRSLRHAALISTAVVLGLSVALGAVLWRRLTNGLGRSRGSLLEAEERVQRLAASDLLTGLDNRAALHDAMQALMGRARRHGEGLAVLMVDLDRFKPVNDRHGHMVGDLVLKEVARRLSRCLRTSDLRARYGGDEFVVVVDESEGPGSAQGAAERIVERLGWPMQFGEIAVNIGASVGIARFPHDAVSDDELLRKADSALYRAKQAGRGTVCLYDPLLDEALAERHTLEVALREGIAAGQLVPYYQPIVDLHTRQVRSVELLCRWKHPERGLLGPDRFIQLAEDTGLIGPLTMSLLRQACKDLARFPAHWRLSFNVAPQQIQDENLVPALLAQLRDAGVPPQRLDVELTETALVNDTARAREVILALKRAGMTVTLDDFGTGYSSLSYLAEMTFDKIKIDRSFVRTLGSRPESAKIVAAIVGLSRSLAVDTVAEGVETEDEAEMLKELGCKNGQGYLFGRPGLAKDVGPLERVPDADAWALVD
ncbi:putative bifunctional diguanylate cyclase/phosphodiesterase [Rubrivivax rivuli]|uniref:EAL domain-containing protein n=1 Tax=Rubrivivax rivuli TaxID=1862385 RepID=A0A437REM5_9BURK|nr:EAL domain-containing protein [Rubrivivax rivuli]RVU45201.1 EAL domain-containing protein [Rubrivivax rivuli]